MARHRRHEVGHPDEWSEWVHPLPGYRFACCECGLVHEMQFDVGEGSNGEKGVVIFRARRHNRATSATRRYMRGDPC